MQGWNYVKDQQSKMATWYMNINFPNIMLVGLLLNSMASERQKTNVSG